MVINWAGQITPNRPAQRSSETARKFISCLRKLLKPRARPLPNRPTSPVSSPTECHFANKEPIPAVTVKVTDLTRDDKTSSRAASVTAAAAAARQLSTAKENLPDAGHLVALYAGQVADA